MAAGGDGGANLVEVFWSYVNATQDRETVAAFHAVLQRHGVELGDDIMAYAHELLAEGEAKGRAEGLAEGLAEGERRAKLKMVDELLKAGAGWEMIETATGWSESIYREIRDREGTVEGG